MLGEGEEKLKQRLARCGLPLEAIAKLFSHRSIVRYPKGSPLQATGSSADAVFAVMSGMVKVYCSGWHGMRVLVDLAGPGDIAGYANLGAASPGQPPLYEAEALTGASVALFTRHDLLRVLRGLEAGTLLALTEAINSLWSAMVCRYARYLVMPLRERLNDVIAELARRYGTRTDQGVMLLPELGQEALAEMIGGSRPMVSKLLNEMTAEGVIARERRHYVLLTGQPEKTNAADSEVTRPITSARALRTGSPGGDVAPASAGLEAGRDRDGYLCRST
jgi:CRP/FNR family transcriptional regulator, cyclic AMP receptor protein